MKTKKYITVLLMVFSGLSFVSTVHASAEGYWKGYYQYQSAIEDGKDRPDAFTKYPLPLYIKIEQVDKIIFGFYTEKFGAEEFKESQPIGNVSGTISNSNISLILKEGLLEVLPGKLLFEIEAKLKGDTIIGEFTKTYPWHIPQPLEMPEVPLPEGLITIKPSSSHKGIRSIYKGIIYLERY